MTRPKMKSGAILGIIRLVAILLISISGFSFWKKTSFVRDSVKTTGRIVDLERKESLDKERRTRVLYYPVFSFVDQGQVEHRVTSRAGNNPPRYSMGDTVEVGYLAHDPLEAEILGEWMFWMAPVLCGIFGLIFGLIGFFGRRRKNPV